MTPLDWNTLATIATVAGCSAGGAWWLSFQFSSVRRLIHEEMREHRKEDDERFSDHLERIQRVEYKTFGRTFPGSG